MFLLISAHPGFPGQSPESHKMVGGIVVWPITRLLPKLHRCPPIKSLSSSTMKVKVAMQNVEIGVTQNIGNITIQ